MNLFSSSRSFVTLLLLLIIISITYVNYSVKQINRETKVFINTTMLVLLADWDEKKFFNYSSYALQQNLTETQLNQINDVFIELGSLLNYHGAYGGLFRSSTSWWLMNPRYTVVASFDGGEFIGVITLIKQNSQWSIGRFEYKYNFFPIQRDNSSLKLVGAY
ncbi:hypothetical protein [Candidatus Marithrix sp. Canyon 246]|uniref:hypothetical protein n=1 Tax=Candidatus Marithrix sp. Canyon 246 TaxID=1827136 RepID=UPI000849FF25|nr:hypothetical protein [Candidatus Marithrix sp. Canyon 246]